MSTDPVQPDPELPPRLAAKLASLNHHDLAIPPELDAAILAESRRRILARRPTALWLRSLKLGGAGAAAAAALAISVHLFHTTPVALHNDLNHDGRVDILDAFYLAKHLNTPVQSWDVNGDGKVDQADVDALAATAVRVGGVQ